MKIHPSDRGLVPPTAYAVPHERSSPRVAEAWSVGCCGVATDENRLIDDRPIALFGSPERVELVAEAKRQGRDIYYVDHGYWRRSKQFRISKNRMQSYVDTQMVIDKYNALTPGEKLRTPERFADMKADIAPEWNRGASIIICPNSPAYMAWFGIDAKQWTLDVARQVAQHTDRPIIIRWKKNASLRPFYLDVHDAHATVVFSSGAAVESLSYGVPVFVLADWATTAPMGLADLSQIETPYYPEHRIPFLWELAERQWTLDEIRSGYAWHWFAKRHSEASI